MPTLRPAARALFFALPLLAGCSSVAPSLTATAPTITTTAAPTTIANLQSYTNPAGTHSTYSSAAVIDLTNAFFQPLGTNGRTCATCHQLNQGMSISAAATQTLFTSSGGADPLFANIDGANFPTAIASDSAARSLLLTRGLLRIPITLPATAQFTITATHDPYGCAITISATGQKIVSVYRRPLPISTIPTLSSVMWDTRETASPLSSATTLSVSLSADLTQQATDALSTHMQATGTPAAAALTQMIAFAQTLSVAQATDTQAGSLSAGGGQGGAANLAAIAYYPGINDAFGGDPTGKPFDPAVFTLYNAWRAGTAPQASINRGQGVFNNSPMQITNVRGINDNAALGSPNNLRGTCSTCHDTPNIGSHSLPLPLDTATSRIASSETDAAIIAGLAQLSAPDLPIFQITGCRDQANRPITYTTTDPGKALSTGLCADVNRMKVPSLRGLAARAPYFHGGAANTLQQLVGFYNARFQMNLSTAQQTDLINFLNAL